MGGKARFSRFRKIPPPKQPKPLLMNDIVYLTKRFETISIKTKHYPGRGSIEEIATLIDWRDGNEVRVASALVYATKSLRPSKSKS